MTTTKNLLSEGAKSYIDALTAVRAFERAACDVCKGVYDKNKPRLVRKMWLQDGQREDHDKNKEPENWQAELGVCQDSPSRRETFYVYLSWDSAKDGVPEITACVCLEFSKKSDRNDCAKLLRKIRYIQLGDDSWYPYLWSS